MRTRWPLRLSEHSEVQPDIAVVTFRGDYYVSAHPMAEDALLAIEVSDTTLQYDVRARAALQPLLESAVLTLGQRRNRACASSRGRVAFPI